MRAFNFEDNGKLWCWFEQTHDTIFSARNRKALKRTIIQLSVFSFVLHLLLIFLAHAYRAPQAWIEALGSNYLSAIATPFNFILFYEVLTLIATLPDSTTRSISNQFEIVSLIFIRDVFHDVAHAGDLVDHHRVTPEILPLFMDMWAGVAMYLLVAIFRHISMHHISRSRSGGIATSIQAQRFVMEKKVVAASLALMLLAMGIWNAVLFIVTAVRVTLGQPGTLESATSFYNDVFTVMIFTDVLILILSLVASDRYEMVFRNAAFVVSIVLIRFALTEGYPFGAPLALMAMLFGIATLLVYNYHVRNNGPVF